VGLADYQIVIYGLSRGDMWFSLDKGVAKKNGKKKSRIK
jgi:hypothetical protein